MEYFLGGIGAGALLVFGYYWFIIGRHRRMPSLTKFVAFTITVLLIYTVAEMISSTMTGVSHDTLTTCFFACFGGEILSCALIKIFKLKEENNE
jgi:hypothetical protein